MLSKGQTHHPSSPFTGVAVGVALLGTRFGSSDGSVKFFQPVACVFKVELLREPSSSPATRSVLSSALFPVSTGPAWHTRNARYMHEWTGRTRTKTVPTTNVWRNPIFCHEGLGVFELSSSCFGLCSLHGCPRHSFMANLFGFSFVNTRSGNTCFSQCV